MKEAILRVVFMGTPEFAVPILEQLLCGGYNVVAVYTQPDRTAGRGRANVEPPVKVAARQRNIRVVQPENLKSPEEAAKLAELKPDVIVVAALGQILPESVLKIPPYGCLNVHPSLLPRFRGASPVEAAILAGDDFTGTSIMLLDKGMDTGPVLLQTAVEISPLDNAATLREKLSKVSARLLLEALGGWIRREITPRPQDETMASYCFPVRKQDGVIDWKLPALDIWRRVRAYFPWPGSYTTWRGKQVKILDAEPGPADKPREAGLVVPLKSGESEIGIVTGNGILAVTRIQLEGKRAMSAVEFTRGQPDFIGSVLPS